jgi:hypothetical protein
MPRVSLSGCAPSARQATAIPPRRSIPSAYYHFEGAAAAAPNVADAPKVSAAVCRRNPDPSCVSATPQLKRE